MDSTAFARHYYRSLGDFFSSGYLDVSVPPVPFPQCGIRAHDRTWVSPFGNLWITGCWRLPRAYRGLHRPSSALRAKASTACPYLALCCHFCEPLVSHTSGMSQYHLNHTPGTTTVRGRGLPKQGLANTRPAEHWGRAVLWQSLLSSHVIFGWECATPEHQVPRGLFVGRAHWRTPTPEA